MPKHWIAAAKHLLSQSLGAVPHEINEIDWKGGLSPNNARLVEHLIAFANHPSGGFLAFGIRDHDAELIGVQSEEVKNIISTLTNLARTAT